MGSWNPILSGSQNNQAQFFYHVDRLKNILEVNALNALPLKRHIIVSLDNLANQEECTEISIYAVNEMQIHLRKLGFTVKSAVADDFSEINHIDPEDANKDLERGVCLEWDILKMSLPREKIRP